MSASSGVAPEALPAVGHMKLAALEAGVVPLPFLKVSQTCDSRENARTAEKLKDVEPAGMF